MRETKIVTSFVTFENKFLLLKRSNKVKSMQGLWAGISGIIEPNETPLERAKIEIFEEVGIDSNDIDLINSIDEMKIISPQYKNHAWKVFPFLFSTKNANVKLNWENSEFLWIKANEIRNFETVPRLEEVLTNLLQT